MRGKIAVEEHFAPAALREYTPEFGPKDSWSSLLARIEDFDGVRLEEMDALGIEVAALSFTAMGIQDIRDTAEAVRVARQANDDLAERIARRPDRFVGLAALPMQDPAAAAEELRRTVGKLGFRGALVNGATLVGDRGVYYDAPEYEEFWLEVARLAVPFYLHPRTPLPGNEAPFAGRPELIGPTWSFAVETGTHALRLLTSGLFDRIPSLTVIIGHMGEFLPFAIERLQQRLAYYDSSLERSPREVLQENFYLTISGNYHTPSLIAAMLQVGADRLLFATDYPFEKMADAAAWFDNAPISEPDKLKIGRTNAQRVLRLSMRDAHEPGLTGFPRATVS